MNSGWRRLRPRTWKGWLVYTFLGLLILGALVGDSEESGEPVPGAEAVQTETSRSTHDQRATEREERLGLQRERQRLRKERAHLRRERAEAHRELVRARKAQAAARRERERQQQLEAPAAPPPPEPEASANCHPSYDPCLDPDASDYDCDGGSGDGPMYTGFVTVKGSDDYDLDSDGDGTGCES